MIPTQYLALAKALGAAVLLALIFAAGWHVKARFDAATISDLKLEHAREDAKRAETAAQEAVRAASVQTALQSAVDKSRSLLDDATAQIAARDAALARMRTDAIGLRDQLAAFGRPLPGDSLAACEDRSRQLADVAAEGVGLLDAGRELLRQAARDHDTRAEELKAFAAAWPIAK